MTTTTLPRGKAEISANYIEEWHEATQEYTLAPEGERCAVVAGANAHNIGGSIARSLADRRFLVTRVDIASQHKRIEDFSFTGFEDTLVLANGRTHLDWVEDQSMGQIAKVVGDTLTASIQATTNFVAATKHTRRLKTIVFVGSMAYRAVLNGSAPYCAAKAGLAHFARCCAWELAPKGYRVFIVHPSNTEDTPMTEETISGLMRYRHLGREAAESYWGAVRALPRWLQKGDIADIVEFLCCEDSAEWLAGAQLELGGGTR